MRNLDHSLISSIFFYFSIFSFLGSYSQYYTIYNHIVIFKPNSKCPPIPLVFRNSSSKKPASSWIRSSMLRFPIPKSRRMVSEKRRRILHRSPLAKATPARISGQTPSLHPFLCPIQCQTRLKPDSNSANRFSAKLPNLNFKAGSLPAQVSPYETIKIQSRTNLEEKQLGQT